MASIKNSIGRAQAKITLDPKDRNPVETVEYICCMNLLDIEDLHFHLEHTILDLVDYLGNAGIDVAVTGNPGYPETAF